MRHRLPISCNYGRRRRPRLLAREKLRIYIHATMAEALSMFTITELLSLAAAGGLGGGMYWLFAQRRLVLARARAALSRR